MKRKKKKKKRIRRLRLAEMCNVKHHRCQLGNLGPGLAPIHKSRRLGRRAGPMWTENGVASGPLEAGGGWPGRATARKALGRAGRAGAAPGRSSAGRAGLAWVGGESGGAERGVGKAVDRSAGFPEIYTPNAWSLMSCRGGGLLLFIWFFWLGEERGRSRAPDEGARLWSSRAAVKIREGRRACGRERGPPSPLSSSRGLWL